MKDSVSRDTAIFNATMAELEQHGFLGKLDAVAFPSGKPVAASTKRPLGQSVVNYLERNSKRIRSNIKSG